MKKKIKIRGVYWDFDPEKKTLSKKLDVRVTEIAGGILLLAEEEHGS